MMGEDQPIIGCGIHRGEEHHNLDGLLDTGTDVIIIPSALWLSHWDLQPRQDSAYVVRVVSRAENSVLREVSNPNLFSLLSKLIQLISHQEQPYYVKRVRLNTDLLGFVAEGNRRADALAAPIEMANLPDLFQQSRLRHQQFHQNVLGLAHQFHLRQDQPKAIVATCPNCQRFAVTSLASGVNPRVLNSCEVWQMDVTHVPQFSKLKYMHVCTDTFSGAIYASAHRGELTFDAQKHLMQAFSLLGIPMVLKMDNGPTYASKAFVEFLQQWAVEHKKDIPYSPTSQVIIERMHQSLKRTLEQQKGGRELISPAKALQGLVYYQLFKLLI
ncbi:hypothetical protein DUI87_20263 [Hirundo rustica rustica]|uniref:RNA-directed DNA polymerase n=1 Tax=Hirundo rustica rustica TaxID=333673 RepID=A0A3M0JWA4_HIRRU|nr:hypothetical protein DUI87_20263 [Hirundo rustica rustica]